MENYLLIIYGCDYGPNGRGLGKESKARIQKALEYIEKKSINPVALVLAAGAPKNKEYKPLKEYMSIRLRRHFLKKSCESSTFIIPNLVIAEEQCWGTFEETVFANNIADCYDCSRVIVVSSWYHLYRIALTFNLLAETKTIELVPSWKISSWLSPFLEFLKIPKVVLDYSKYKKKSGRKQKRKKLP